MHQEGTGMMRADCIRELGAVEFCRITVKPTYQVRTGRNRNLRCAA